MCTVIGKMTASPTDSPSSHPPATVTTAGSVGGPVDVVEAVAAAVTELQYRDPFAEVLVLSPPGPTAETLRRRLPFTKQGRGIAGIRYTTVVDLAGEILDAAHVPRRPLTPTVLAAFVEHELADHCPLALAGIRDDHATVKAVVAATERLRHLPAGDTAAIHDLAGNSVARRAMVDVALGVRKRLRAAGFTDEAATLRMAIDALGAAGKPLAPVVIVCTDLYAPGQRPFLRQLVAQRGAHIRIVHANGWPGDTELAEQVSAITGSVPHAQVSADDTGQLSLALDGPLPLPARLTTYPDADEEARGAVRRVLALTTAPDPVPLDRIAILYPQLSTYRRSLVEELDRAGLPWAGHAPYTLGESIAGTVVRRVLAVGEGASATNVFAVFGGCPPARFGPAWLGKVTRLSRQLRLVRPTDWAHAHDRLTEYQHDRRERRLRNGEQPDSARDDDERETLTALLSEVDRLVAATGAITAATSWADASQALVDVLHWLLGDATKRATRWSDVPEWQHKAANQLIDQLGALADLGDSAVQLAYRQSTLGRIVDDLLERPVGRQGNAAVGVRVAAVTDGLCLDADHVLLIGANDGIVPQPPGDSTLTPSSAASPSARWVEHRRWGQHRATRAWHAVLAGRATVEVSWARSDIRRGGALYPSRLLPAGADKAADVVASHGAALRTGPALTVAEQLLDDDTAWQKSAVVRRRLLATRSRRTPQWSVYEGAIGPQKALDPSSRVHAVTAFESLAQCGIHYFMRFVLGVTDDGDVTEQEAMTPLDRGNLLHGVLERLVADHLANPAAPPWLQGAHRSATLQRAAELLDQDAARLDAVGALGPQGRWRAERAVFLSALTKLLTDEDGTCLPTAAELSFGRTDSSPGLEIATPSGPVRFRGQIDRLDQLSDGSIRVTDFKVKSGKSIDTMKVDDPTAGGAKLQLAVYAQVAQALHVDRPVSARYLYLHRATTLEDMLPDGAIDVANDDIRALAARIVEGDFHPGMPHVKWGCAWCCPDSLGTADVEARVTELTPPDHVETSGDE